MSVYQSIISNVFWPSLNTLHGGNRYPRQVSGVFLVSFRLITLPGQVGLPRSGRKSNNNTILPSDLCLRGQMYVAISLLLLHFGYFPLSIKEFRLQTLLCCDLQSIGYFRSISQYYCCNMINAAWFKDSIHSINAVALVQFPSLMASSSQDFNFHEL